MPARSSLRVGIDLTALLPQRTGVDVALINVARHLAELPGDDRFVVFVNHEDLESLRATFPPRLELRAASLRPRAARLVFQQLLLPTFARRLALDVVHSPSFIAPLLRGGAGQVLTIHDLTSFVLPEHHVPFRRSWPYRKAIERSARNVDLVTVPSRAVAASFERVFPRASGGKLRVVGWGVGDAFRPRDADEARRRLARYALPPSFVLCVGTLEPRKNLAALLDAFESLIARGQNQHLVLAGKRGWAYEELLARIHGGALAGRVHYLGYVPEEDLPWLYAAARVFAYPSLEEGFGLPPLEAMACGVPVVSSTGSSLEENLSGAAELVDPRDGLALADALARLLGDEPLRARHREAGLERASRFRWSDTAAAFAACYREAASTRNRPVQGSFPALSPGPSK